jgi:DNA-binding winged helix-turn-helix (wHTH) protein
MAASRSPAGARIGAFTFDAERRQLLGPRGAVPLAPREFDLVALLVANRPRALAKDEIQDALWPDRVVTETSLSTLVNELRNKLGQVGRDGPIRTVHGFGYALADDREPDATLPAPRLVRGKTEIVLDASETVLGRDPGLRGTIADASVSRRHASVRWDGRCAVLEDLGSKNGTYLRGERLVAPALLEDGDEIRFGLVTFVYRVPQAFASTMSVG